MRVLITGATGFLGSNISKLLIIKGITVYATYRNTSNFIRCESFKKDINWINTDDCNWKEYFININIDILIHTAWQGVESKDRDNWDIQLSNFKFSKDIYDVAKAARVKKIITLGSQAEYGIYDELIDENAITIPNDAYSSVKLLSLYFFRNFATNNKIEWYWIRVFSVFGNGENQNWLIPSIIRNLLNGDFVDLTEGNQKYDYMHSDDFVINLFKVINSKTDLSGVYNLCSGNPIELRTLLINISNLIPNTRHLLNFGALPYRKNQNMFIVGNNKKFERAFGSLKLNDLESNLQTTINLYKNN